MDGWDGCMRYCGRKYRRRESVSCILPTLNPPLPSFKFSSPPPPSCYLLPATIIWVIKQFMNDLVSLPFPSISIFSLSLRIFFPRSLVGQFHDCRFHGVSVILGMSQLYTNCLMKWRTRKLFLILLHILPWYQIAYKDLFITLHNIKYMFASTEIKQQTIKLVFLYC